MFTYSDISTRVGMKACGLVSRVCTICELSNYLIAQKEAGPLRDLSLNPEEKQCFPSEKAAAAAEVGAATDCIHKRSG